MDHVQNAALGVVRRQHAIRPRGIGKFWTYRKTKHPDLFRSDSGCSQDRSTLLVCHEKIIGGDAAVPRRVDSNRVGYYDDTFTRSRAFGVSFLNLPEYACISGERANHDVWLKTLEQCGEVFLEPRETREFCIEIFLAIEPAVNGPPGAKLTIAR